MRGLYYSSLLLGLAGWCGLATVPTQGRIYHVGDSITGPQTGASAGHGYVTLLDAALGVIGINLARSGDQAADQAIAVRNAVLGGGDAATVYVGTNDHWRYGTNAKLLGNYRQFLTSILLDLGAPSRTQGRSDNIHYTEPWSNSKPSWSTGKFTTKPGAKATAVVAGTAVYVGTILRDNTAGPGGLVRVTIDGADVGTCTSDGQGITTLNGTTSAPAACRFGGLGGGNHEVMLTFVPEGNLSSFNLEYIAGSAQSVRPRIFVSNIQYMASAGYKSLGNASSNANVDAYNAVIAAVQSQLANDGLNVTLVDNNARIDTATELAGDGIHPNDAGHYLLEQSFYRAISATGTAVARH